MRTEGTDIALRRSRPPALSRNNVAILCGFVILMSIQNSVLKFHPTPGEPRFNIGEIGYNFGNGFGILFLFWVICKGIAVARQLEIRSNIVYIAFSIIGVVLYVAVFVFVVLGTGDLLVIIIAFVPLMLGAYFVVGFLLGLVARAIKSGPRDVAREPG